MRYNIDHIEVNLERENDGIRLKTDNENWFIPNQTIEETKKITEINYYIVKEHFQNKTGQIITETDLENVCFSIVLHYFQMYNHWRTMYKRETNRDLTFLQKDFDQPYTSSIIFDFFEKNYPDNYSEKCELLLGMTSEQFKEYAISKEEFDNR